MRLAPATGSARTSGRHARHAAPMITPPSPSSSQALRREALVQRRAHAGTARPHRRGAAALNAFVTVDPRARWRRRARPTRRSRAVMAAPLTGIPIAHKDVLMTAGLQHDLRLADARRTSSRRTTRSSSSGLSDAGTVLVGKTNMDEFAMGSSNETSYFGPVQNPWNADCVPGGSSGGSAAAVAARLVPGATGTDTGGSIRQPAALSGICGIKPTYGVCSRYGLVAFASSLDHAGRRSRADGRGLRAAAERDGRPRCARLDLARPAARGLRARLDAAATASRSRACASACRAEYFGERHRRRRRARRSRPRSREFRKLGATTVDIALPNVNLSVPVYYVIAPAEASSNLSRFDGVRYGHRAAKYARPRRHVQEDARRRLRRRGEAPHPRRHLRALARLLRRLLPEGAAGAAADRRRFPRAPTSSAT